MNLPNFITRLCLLSKLFSKMCFVFNAKAFDDVMTLKYLKNYLIISDYLKNEKSFRSEIKTFFLVSKVLSFRHTKQTSKNVADATFKMGVVFRSFSYND